MTDFLDKKKQKQQDVFAEGMLYQEQNDMRMFDADGFPMGDDAFEEKDLRQDFAEFESHLDEYQQVFDKEIQDDIKSLLALDLRKTSKQKSASKGKVDKVYVDSLKEQDEEIRAYMQKLEDGTITVEDREQTLAQLEMMLNRNEAEIMMNDQKFGGDSKRMTRVKQSIDVVENMLSKKHSKGMKKADMDALNANYEIAIEACMDYLANQGSLIKSWSGRKALVRDMLTRLKNEAALVRLGSVLFEEDQAEGAVVKSGMDLITLSRMYQLGGAMKTHIRPAEPADVKDAVPVNKALSSVMPVQKDKKAKSADIVPSVHEIREFLYQTVPGEAKAAVIEVGGQSGCLVYRENGSVQLVMGEKIIELGNAEKIKDDIEEDIFSNKEKRYGDEDVMRALGSYAGIDVENASPATLVRGRRLFTEILSKKTGIGKPDFDNVPFMDLRLLAVGYLSGDYDKAEIKKEVDHANDFKWGSVNTEAEMELMRTQTVDVSNVKYSITCEEKENHWTKEEELVKNMVAELIYFEDTREQDAFYADKTRFDENGNLTKETAAERMRDVLLKNADTLSVILVDTYKKGEKKKIDMAYAYSNKFPGLSEEEIQKKVEADYVPEPTILDNMIDKLPIFMAGDEGAESIKKSIRDAISGVIKKILDEIDATVKNKVLNTMAKAALAAPAMLETKIRKQLKDAKAGSDLFNEMGDGYITLQNKVTEMENQVDSMMGECTSLFFGAEETKDKETDPEDIEVEEETEEVKTEEKTEEVKADAVKTAGVKMQAPASVPTPEEKAKKEAEESKARTKAIYDRIKAKKAKYKECKAFVEAYNKKVADPGYKPSPEEKERAQKDAAYVRDFTENERKELKKNLDDVAKGNKGQGAYLKNVMKSYFGSLSAIDKRSMIASAIRNAKPLKQSYTKEQFDHLDNKEKMNIYGEYMGGMFKGAGPLFQKLLQGLPVGAIPKGLQKAIDDMKDSLAPIPEKIVKERMSAIIENSKGKVKSIDVLKSLGAASVGQAFLCKMYGPAYPEGKEVVIKLLRPDVRNRMVRERKIMEEAAKKVDRESAGIPETDTKYTGGMYATFQGTYKRIEEELDLTLEAKNVEAGQCYNNCSKNSKYVKKKVKVMQLDKDIDAGPDTMVLEKAEGTTAKRYMSDTREELNRIMDPFYEKKPNSDGILENVTAKDDDNLKYVIKSDFKANDFENLEDTKKKIDEMIAKTEARQKYLLEISDTWSREAIFKGGFYHGDLHAGNIMLDDNGATIIDFGNATQLTEEQLTHVTRMMIAAGRSDIEPFFEGYHKLLENTPEKDWNRMKDELKAVFTEVLNIGTEKDSALRISVALMRAQELGFELPPSIANFASCQLRLQNAVDDMNGLLMELKATRAKMDKMVIENSNYLEDASVYNKYSQLADKSKDNKSLSQKLQKVKEDYGISQNPEFEEKFREQLRSKKDRIAFMREHIAFYSPRGEINMADLLLRKEFDELTEEELEALSTDDVPSQYLSKSLKPLLEKLKEKTIDPNADATAYYALDNIMISYLGEVSELLQDEDGVKAYKPKGLLELLGESEALMAVIPEETELDKAVREYFEAQDRGETEEVLKELEDRVWTEKKKKIDEKPAAKDKHDSQLSTMMTISYGYERAEADDAAKVNVATVLNQTCFRQLEEIMHPFFKEAKYGKALEQVLGDYKAITEECGQKLEKDEELEKKLEEAKKKILDLSFKAQVNVLKTLDDKTTKEIDKKKYVLKSTDEPDNFFDVMGDVIQRNKGSAFLRVGILKSAGIAAGMAWDAVKGFFSKNK